MKFINSPIFVVLFIVFSGQLYAQPIDSNTAKIIAKNHLLSVGKNKLKSANSILSTFRFSTFSVESENKDTLYFVINDSINRCFVIVSADKRLKPIIGYSLEGNFNKENQPPAFVAWMESWKKEISLVKNGDLPPNSKTTAIWDNLLNASQVSDSESVEPLLTTQWGQGQYYNFACPYDNQAYTYTLTGCLATAMAQVMKYWNFPTVGKGQHSYYSNYGTQSADFGSTNYHWDQMANILVSANDAVASLMYHCGVAVNMNYGVEESGADQPRDAFVNHFRYSPDAQFVFQKNYTKTDWVDLIKTEINEGRPVWYQGPSLEGEPHAFVCDGYEKSDLIHINWGWNGSYNGYYSLVTDSNSGVITGLTPGNDGFDGFFLPTDTFSIGTNGGADSINIYSSVNWSTSSDKTWLSVNPESGGSGSSTISFVAVENDSGSDRSATITISATGHNDQFITILQPAKVSVTPGELANVFKNLTPPVTSLTLTGEIDVRDFITMRDKMLDLTKVDLSEVTVVEYTGKDGTHEYYTTYPANTVPYKAFCGNQKIKNIILSTSIFKIDNNAFADCSALSSVTIPSPHAKIGAYVFEDCFNLTSFEFPSSNTVINKNTFFRCRKLNSVNIPDMVTKIENDAFYSCSGLKSVSIPATVTSIGRAAFYECNGLNSIYALPIIPVDLSSSNDVFAKVNKSSTTLYVPFGSAQAYQAANQWKDFMNITEMSGLFLSGNILTMSSSADTISYNFASSSDWTVNSDQAWLTIDQLSGTQGSQTIVITATSNLTGEDRAAIITVSANGVDTKTISVTQYSTLEVTAGNLSTILGESLSTVTSLVLSGTIDARDFKTMSDEMPALTEIDLSSVSVVEYTGTEGPIHWENRTYPANEIPEEGLRGKIGLVSIQIPLTTTSIASEAFYYCQKLIKFEIPASINSIGKKAFSLSGACVEVDPANANYTSADGILFNKEKTILIQCPPSIGGEYTIPQSVTIIEDYALSYMTGLTKVTIPASVVSIGSDAFTGCGGLKAIHANPTSPVDLSNSRSVFYNVNKYTCVLYVPVGSKSAYSRSDQWEDFRNIVEEVVSTTNDLIFNTDDLQFKLYPNPTSGVIKLQYNGNIVGSEEIILTNNIGQIIRREKLNQKETWMDLSGFSTGMYFIKISPLPNVVAKIILTD